LKKLVYSSVNHGKKSGTKRVLVQLSHIGRDRPCHEKRKSRECACMQHFIALVQLSEKLVSRNVGSDKKENPVTGKSDYRNS
ncbi:MAG TPA: hypothetical protein VM260_06285, partial [Pirellula sp.]|nr:hypothetical protein [Pirellula sp.]